MGARQPTALRQGVNQRDGVQLSAPCKQTVCIFVKAPITRASRVSLSGLFKTALPSGSIRSSPCIGCMGLPKGVQTDTLL